jgi:putative SOS response-associated peptidase YedK
MCGRFMSSTPPRELAEHFGAALDDAAVDHAPSWNVAPTDAVLAVAENREGERRLGELRWGLVPSWAKDTSIASRMINLRAQTVSEKASFLKTLRTRRCILPADGFYEWKDMGKGRKKQPFFIRAKGGGPLGLAGLWEVWKDRTVEDAEWLRTCTVITTEPNATLAPLHDRMPVVLPPEAWDTWLDRDVTDIDVLTKLLVPAPDDLLELWPVSPDVGNVGNNHAQLILPLDGHQPE